MERAKKAAKIGLLEKNEGRFKEKRPLGESCCEETLPFL